MDEAGDSDTVFREVDADLFDRAAAVAAARGESLPDVLSRILREYIDSPPPMSE